MPPTPTQKAVEAELKIYKQRVASVVKRYQDSDDLCTSEANRIRDELELDDFLGRSVNLHLDLIGDLKVTRPNPDTDLEPNDSDIASAIADKVLELLVEGMALTVNKWAGGRTHKITCIVSMEKDTTVANEAYMDDND